MVQSIVVGYMSIWFASRRDASLGRKCDVTITLSHSVGMRPAHSSTDYIVSTGSLCSCSGIGGALS